MQSEGDEGGICVVAESCHQTSEGIGLMASLVKRILLYCQILDRLAPGELFIIAARSGESHDEQ